MTSKIYCFYLPQFHRIPENDAWWGEGFTEWVNVAKAQALYKDHYLPIPGELGFYDLSDSNVLKQQAELAKLHRIDGFMFWHYWFGDGDTLLEKPVKSLLQNKGVDIEFALSWANHSWERKTWNKDGDKEVLKRQSYFKGDVIKHWDYILPFLKDSRYIKIGNRPVFTIFDPLKIEGLNMLETWNELAKAEGWNGIYFIARDSASRSKKKLLSMGFDAIYNDDVFNVHHELNILSKLYLKFKRDILGKPSVFEYSKAARLMLGDDAKEDEVIPLIAPNWDHSPRSGNRAIILKNSTPEKFGKLLLRALSIIEEKNNPILLIKSWNEWGEGNTLEPDIKFGRGYLEQIRDRR